MATILIFVQPNLEQKIYNAEGYKSVQVPGYDDIRGMGVLRQLRLRKQYIDVGKKCTIISAVL